MAGCVAGVSPTPAELATMQVTPCSADSLPTGAAFYAEIQNRLASGQLSTDWNGDVPGFFNVPGLGNRLLWATIRYEMTMLEFQSPTVTRHVYDQFRDFTDGYLSSGAPSTLASLFPWADSAFSWMVTQQRLVDGMVTGFLICFPMAFIVLFFSTGSFRVAVLATASIALIVGTLLGIAQSVLGYDLGTGESISGTIVIGLSVDYTVHLGHIYTESPRTSREGKMQDAVSVMGPTVVAGGITTLGCALFMFPCQLTFFTKMANLMAFTIIFSLLYSFFFFIPLLTLIGPREVLSIRTRLARLCGRGRVEEASKSGEVVRA